MRDIIDIENLLKEIGCWYGNYKKEDGKYIIDNGEKLFVYDNVQEGLIDWLGTLEEDDCMDWSKEIELIKSLM